MVCDDLKFKNNGIDTKQLMLNTKLREEKKIRRKNSTKKKKTTNKKNINKTKSGSKFNEKYRERILSIQNSDFQREQNMRLADELNNKSKTTNKRGRKKKTDETQK